ncbi:RNA polymerase I specific transcription initiation factor RRN3 [Fragilaria crotonensis]|nr:RNA polymerase I specific transcription initiation factor RRN3 [Fragilaria crotonensis]
MAVLEQGTNTPGRNDVRSLCELHSLFTLSVRLRSTLCFRGTDAVQYFREAVKYWENTDKTRDSLYPDLDHIDIAPERWEKVCGHKLQPLRFCLESVREEFIFFAESFTLLPPKLLKNLDLDAQLQSSRPKRRGKLINTPSHHLQADGRLEV